MKCESCGHDNLDDARFCASCGLQLTHQSEDGWIGRLVGGRFKVTRVLGEGGMGVVYAAEQQMGSTVRRAAIKTLHPHLSKDPSVLARFHRECGTVAQLEHPNTIKVFDFGSEADGTLYIAMEFVEGQSLDRVIDSDAPLAPARVVDILEQVCGALDEAHDQGIVHRDLKPENVILGEKLGKPDFVKVLDFGIAARRESGDRQKEQKLTQQGMVLGTPPYMSPEQFTGAELDRRSDVYSLGVMAYEMLTGELPFQATTPWQWATEHMTAQPFPIEQRPSGAGVPVHMRDAVMQALAKLPEERPATAGQFVERLRRGLGVSATAQTAATEAMQAVPMSLAQTGLMPSLDAPPGAAARSPQGAAVRGSGGVPGMSGNGLSGSAASDGVSTPSGTDAVMASTPARTPAAKKPSMGLIMAGLVGLLGLGGGAILAFGGGPSGTDSGEAEPQEPELAAQDAESPEPGPDVRVPEGSDSSGKPDASKPTGTAGPGAAHPSNPTPAPGPSPSPAPSPAPPPGPAPSPAPSPAPAPSPSPAPAPQVDCSSCVNLVRSGSWTSAANVYAACDSATKAQCNAAARQAIRGQVTSAVAAGECSRARSIVAAGTRMGVSVPQLQKAAANCK